MVIRYEVGSWKTIRFPGGTNRSHPGESPKETIKREWEIEVGGELGEVTGRPHFEPTGPGHTKMFFLLGPEAFSEDGWRTRTHIDKSTRRPDECLSPPVWMSEKELRKVIFKPHRRPFEAACSEIRRRNGGLY